MKIAGYLKTSLIEWPGKITSVIFTPGCNFRCPFCHNADLVDDKIERLPRIDEEQILADLEKRKKWVDAVVVTGGEPTLQPDLLKFLKSLKFLKFLTMIHTNGTRPDVLASILNSKSKILNFIAMDIKGNFDEYNKYTGWQMANGKWQKYMGNVKSSIKLIVDSGVEYEFRTTVVPGLHDIKNLISLAEQLKFTVYSLQSTDSSNSAVVSRPKAIDSLKWFLQQFRSLNTLDKSYLKIKPYSKEQMEIFQKELQKIIPQTYLRGI